MLNHYEASQLSHDELAQVLKTCPRAGLTSFEARDRVKTYGLNKLQSPRSKTASLSRLLKIRMLNYFKQFLNPLIQLLLICVIVSITIGEYQNAISVLIAIALVCTISYIQEYRADKSLEKLTRQIPNTCFVLRDCKKIEISCDNLVPGDIVFLVEGARVPADIRVFDVKQLTINESNLTGETHSQTKSEDNIHGSKLKNALDGDPNVIETQKNGLYQNLALMGTLIESGSAKGIVICTGLTTRYGQVYEMLKNTSQPKSPLQTNIDQLSIHLVMIAIFVITATSIIGICQNRPSFEVAYYAISLAVTAIPEGLPVVVAVIMTLGVVRLSKTKTIVKSLNSIETLGCFQILCADKTGTLTRNDMTLTDIVTSELHAITTDEVEVMQTDDYGRQITFTRFAGKMYSIGKLMEVGTLCNNASLEVDSSSQQQNKLIGSATECAILDASIKLGFGDSRTKFERLAECEPFNSITRRMVVQCQRHDQQTQGPMYYVKGAWEEVLANCTDYSESGLVKPKNDDLWLEYEQRAIALGKKGLRVLAMANGSDLTKLTFVGLVGITNTPREGLVETIKKMNQDFKIDVKMITGDSKSTAISVGRDLGLLKGVDNQELEEELFIMSGAEVEKLIRSEMDETNKLNDILSRVIFYRVDPKQKADIICKLQEADKIVAMTGDGINDVISLKRANLSIAMGSGADVCKEIADIIAVDNDPNVLIPAIIEGKAIYQRIQSFLTYQISMSMSLLIMIAISFALKLEAPFSVTQILYLNLLTDGPPAQALGFEQANEEDFTKWPPRDIHKPLLNIRLLGTIFALTTTMTILNEILYMVLTGDGELDTTGRSILFTNFVFSSLFAALSLRSKTKTIIELAPFGNKELLYCVLGVIFLQVLVIKIETLNILFDIEQISFLEIFYILLYSSLVLALMDCIKVTLRLWAYGRRILKERKNLPTSIGDLTIKTVIN